MISSESRARRRSAIAPVEVTVEDWTRRFVAAFAEALLAAPPSCRNPVPTLCRHHGVAPWRACRAFQAVHGMTPLQWLRERRLDFARAELLAAADPRSAVKRVALSYRQWHFGRFAAAYRARFGELPSETLEQVSGGRDHPHDLLGSGLIAGARR